jgi:hypothetical protein
VEITESKMLERLQGYFYSEPGRISGIGKLIFQLGAFLFVAGAIGRVATIATNILPTVSKQLQASKALADIYPAVPLWWVPESWIGLTMSVLLIVSGVCLVSYGKNVDRFLK